MNTRPLIRILTLLTGLCIHNFVSADFDTGNEAYKRGDYETALKEWGPLADAGNADAQYWIGILYANGYGVTQDGKEAARWYRAAAEYGRIDAYYNLYFLYLAGMGGVRQDYQEAVKWLRRGALYGDADCQYDLAQYYFVGGMGITQDYVLAHM